MNDLTFVGNVIELLSDEGIDVWLFGGWAEELSDSGRLCSTTMSRETGEM